jgi:hypothetical protein
LSSPPTDRHDIAVLFLKLALNTINPNPITEIKKNYNSAKLILEYFFYTQHIY